MAHAAVAVMMRQASQRADEQRRDADRSHSLRHARHYFGEHREHELRHADRAQIARDRGDGLPDVDALVRRHLAAEQRRAAGGGAPAERAFAAADDDDLLTLVDEFLECSARRATAAADARPPGADAAPGRAAPPRARAISASRALAAMPARRAAPPWRWWHVLLVWRWWRRGRAEADAAARAARPAVHWGFVANELNLKRGSDAEGYFTAPQCRRRFDVLEQQRQTIIVDVPDTPRAVELAGANPKA